jgi:6-phosphogluconolactonase (cycloisomerase 2 family)
MRLRALYLALSCCLLLASAGCGSSDGNSTATPPSTTHFAYVSNSDSNTISAYKMDSVSGGLTAIPGSPSGTVDAPLGLALNPTADLLAAGNLNGGGISVFRVDKASGAITTVPGSPFSTTGGGFPLGSEFHPTGKFLYAGMQVSTTSNVCAFSVEASTGALTPVPGSPFAGQPSLGGGGVNSIALHPTGNFLYVSGAFLGITAYAVDSGTGVLTQLPGSPLSQARPSTQIVVHPRETSWHGRS